MARELGRDRNPEGVPRISLGMPAYNGEKYIRKAIESLLEQTFADFELVISDDASTDKTEAICREFAARDRRIRYVRQSKNLGCGPNHKFVLDDARGNYFRWTNDDDIWMPTYLSECIGAAEAHNSIDFVVTRHRATSRISFLFNRIYTCDYSFVAESDSRKRVEIFSKMPPSSEKDNLCYAFWKRQAILKVVSDIKSSSLNKILIGGAMNEYALALYKGALVNKVLWHKSYKYLPPGHRLHPVLGPIVNVYRLLQGRSTEDFHKTRRDVFPDDWPTPLENLHNIESVLSLAGFDREFTLGIVDQYRARQKRPAA